MVAAVEIVVRPAQTGLPIQHLRTAVRRQSQTANHAE
jgi:hypothetical protein